MKILIALTLASTLFAQVTDSTQAKAQLQKAKIEKLSIKRDQLFTQRYDALQAQQQEKEQLLSQLESAQSELEQAGLTLEGAQHSSLTLRQQKSVESDQLQVAKSRYLALGNQGGRLQGLRSLFQKATPVKQAQKIHKFNTLRNQISKQKGQPQKVWESMSLFMASAIQEQSQITQGSVNGESFLYLGSVGALKVSTDKAQILLKAEGKQSFAWTDLSASKSSALRQEISQNSNILLLPSDVLLSPAIRRMSIGTEDDSWFKLKEWFAQGGSIGWIILIFFFFGIIISIERVALWARAKHSKKQSKALLANLEKEDSLTLLKKSQSLSRILGRILHAHQNKTDLEIAATDALSSEADRLQRRLTTIALFASVAPLLGLLGTVFGMIELFKVLTLHGSADPRQLAGGISVALVTTQMGLISAIPLLLVHNWVKNRLLRLLSSLDRNAMRALDLLREK